MNYILYILYITQYKSQMQYSLLLYYFMKPNFSSADQKKIIFDTITLLGLEDLPHEKKNQILYCISLGLPHQKDSPAPFKDRLTNYIHTYFHQLKNVGPLFFDFGNLKFLTRESKNLILNIVKKVDEKIGESVDYKQVYRDWIMKNPYFLYQQMGYMTPPYMMPPSYPTDRQGYESFGMDPQQYYLQMTKCFPMNPMYMPPMPNLPNVGVPKYQTQDIKSHPFYTYPMIPPNQNNNYQATQSQKVKASQPQNHNKARGNDGSGKNRQVEGQQNSETNKRKYKERQTKEKNQPFFIIEPSMQKVIREEIPERLVQLPQPIQAQQNINHDSSEIEIVNQIGSPENLAFKNSQANKKNAVVSQNAANPNPQAMATIMKSLEDEKNRKNLAQASQIPIIPLGVQLRVQLQHCVCKGYALVEDFYECSECHKKYHYACTQKNEAGLGEKKEPCHFCFMRALDPLNRVIAQIKTPYVTDIKKNKVVEIIDFQAYDSYISKNSPYEIQIRCMKLEDASNLIPEYTWPDECLVMLDEERTIQFQALQHNSSLKKRKDMSVFLTNYIYFYNKNLAKRRNLTIGLQIKYNNVLQISQKKIRNNHVFIFGIYLIRKITPDELSEEILKDQTNKVSFVQKFFSKPTEQEQVQIQQIKVNLMDPYSWNLIDIPVRGRKCIHGQCFDLKTFLSFMNVSKVRQWRCPVCTKQCRSFFVDTQQMEVIKEFKRKQGEGGNQKFSKQIQFHRDGRTLFVVQKQSEDEQQRNGNSSDCHKTKPIAKST